MERDHPEAYVPLVCITGGRIRVLMMSYRWLTKAHPDPEKW